MNTASGELLPADSDKDIKQLCNLLLEVAGRDATRLISVRRHATVLA